MYVSRVLGDDHKNDCPSHSICNTLKNPYYLIAISTECRSNVALATSPYERTVKNPKQTN